MNPGRRIGNDAAAAVKSDHIAGAGFDAADVIGSEEKTHAVPSVSEIQGSCGEPISLPLRVHRSYGSELFGEDGGYSAVDYRVAASNCDGVIVAGAATGPYVLRGEHLTFELTLQSLSDAQGLEDCRRE